MIDGVEQIDRTTEAPWHRCEMYGPEARLTIHLPPSDPGKSFKEEWARKHKARFEPQPADSLAVYTDGSLTTKEGVRYTGFGAVGYTNNSRTFEAREPTGPCVEVYDAEMEGLAKAAELVKDFILSPRGSDTNSIFFFSDNTAAIHRIYKATPGKSQLCSSRFRKAIHDILDARPGLKVTLEWVPGHEGVEGNEAADDLAKRGSLDPTPLGARKVSAAFAGNQKGRDLREKWTRLWSQEAAKKTRADFGRANQIEPSTRPAKIMQEVNRKTFSRMVQCVTGHAHIGSYYRRFIPTEEPSCPCDENAYTLQTRDHILLSCPRYRRHRHLLRDEDYNLNVDAILGTPSGRTRLARFIEKSGAYDKLK